MDLNYLEISKTQNPKTQDFEISKTPKPSCYLGRANPEYDAYNTCSIKRMTIKI